MKKTCGEFINVIDEMCEKSYEHRCSWFLKNKKTEIKYAYIYSKHE
jgi:hypothetical protein